jgi:hypothetical protein
MLRPSLLSEGRNAYASNFCFEQETVMRNKHLKEESCFRAQQ